MPESDRVASRRARAPRRLAASVPAEVRTRMKRVRQRDTKPELQVRRLITALGIRYRVAAKDLPGRPDIVNRCQGWCVQVHGCFWHGHRRCRRARLPKTNRQFWAAKAAYNRQRDQRNLSALTSAGLAVMTIWECELRDPTLVKERLAAFLVERMQRDDYE